MQELDDQVLNDDPDLAIAVAGFEDVCERLEAAALWRWRVAAVDAAYFGALAQAEPAPKALLVAAADMPGTCPLADIPLVQAILSEMRHIETNDAWPVRQTMDEYNTVLVAAGAKLLPLR